MYQISVDDKYMLFDTRDEELIVESPKCNLETNTVGEASFTIYSNHPQYAKMQKLKALFEIKQGNEIIFRGRMTKDSKDFHNAKTIDLEGAMAFLNDSVVRPFNFPDDFLENQEYITASTSGNVIEFFLGWLIDAHNQQTEPFQHLKLGNVTVTDPNNYLGRSSTEHASTWETVKSKLFESSLGGYLCARYEADGTYIDYLSNFTLVNQQHIQYGGNLLDVKHDSDATSTYTAILPLGAQIEGEDRRLDITSLADGEITDDIVKKGDVIYSKSAVEQYGFILAPIEESTWDDVTEASNLQTKSIALLLGTGVKLIDTVETKAVDMHFSNEEIASFRINRKVVVDSKPHDIEATYDLTRLEIDIANPQNTNIVAGKTERTLLDKNYDKFQNADKKIESAKNELKQYVSSVERGVEQKIEGIDGIFFYIKYSQYADGHVMTDAPDENTQYMGTCSAKLKQDVAPLDYREYTWVKIRGNDGEKGKKGDPGADGKTQYLHIKYSDDGETFTENNGETLGAWIGTLVDFNEADSIVFNDYTWKKFTEDVDEDLGEIRQTILEQRTELINTCDSILMEALKSYTETSSFEEYKEQIASQLKLLADSLTLTFTEEITKTNGAVTELQKINSTYFTFDIDGMTIGKANNPNKVVISNDIISIQVNGVIVQSFDANGRSIIPELKITKSINEFGFITEQDAGGNVNCRYIGS